MLRHWFPARAPSRPRQPLPEALRRRLREIPREEILCRDVDRLWPDYLLPQRRERLPESQRQGLARHFGSCPRCTALAEALAPSLDLAPEPPPPRLVHALRSLPRRRAPLPFYLRDARYAAAASWLLALALVLLLGGPAAIAERSSEVFDRPVRRAAVGLEELGLQGQSFLGRLEGQARSYGEGLNQEWRKVGDGLQRWSEKSWKPPGLRSSQDSRLPPETQPAPTTQPGAASAGSQEP